MPIYEYQCSACGHQCEQLEHINAPKCQVCPKCQAEQLHRLVSRTHFKLTGSGWYETDFKNKQPSTKSETNKDNSSSSKDNSSSSKDD